MKGEIQLNEFISNDDVLTIVSKEKTYEVDRFRLSGFNELTLETFNSDLRPNREEKYMLLLKSQKGRFIAKDIIIEEVKGVFCLYKVKNILFEKQELRNHKRVTYTQKIIAKCYNNEIDGYIHNFSAGGALIKLDTSIKVLKGTLFTNILEENFELPFIVIKSYKQKDLTCLHIQFDDLEEKLVQKLCQLVFKIEIQERRYKKDL